MTVGDPVFVDTNVLIYASRTNAPLHRSAMTALSRLHLEKSALWLSQQVLREYLAASTRPQSTGPSLAMAAAVADVQQFRNRFNIAEDSPEVLDRLLLLLTAHRVSGKQVHDANLVATMLVSGVRRLVTYNSGDFHRFGKFIELVVP